MCEKAARLEQDYLDWLENAGRATGDTFCTDAAFFAACVVLSAAVVTTVWLIRR